MQADAGRKDRLYPTPDQAEILARWGHTCRALWNVALEQREFMWAQRPPGPRQKLRDGGGKHRGYRLRAAEQCAHLTRARADLDWMADLPAQCGQQVLRHMDAAYDNWWNPDHPAAAPARRKCRARMSVPFPGQAVQVTRMNRKWGAVRLPKLGWVRFRWSRTPGGEVRSATVAVDGAGRWHVSFGVATGLREPLAGAA
jgi:putative transposase